MNPTVSRLGGALRQLKTMDDRRASMPGEHLATFGAGLAILRRVPRGRSALGKALALAAGVALIWRAASGRDGIARFARRGHAR